MSNFRLQALRAFEKVEDHLLAGRPLLQRNSISDEQQVPKRIGQRLRFVYFTLHINNLMCLAATHSRLQVLEVQCLNNQHRKLHLVHVLIVRVVICLCLPHSTLLYHCLIHTLRMCSY